MSASVEEQMMDIPRCLVEVQDERHYKIEDFLFDAAHVEVTAWTAKQQHYRDTGKYVDPESEIPEWKGGHLEIFTSAGLVWPPCYSGSPRLTQRLAHLPERMAECAWYHEHSVGKTMREEGDCEVIVDLASSLMWQIKGLATDGVASCFVASQRPWLLLRLRSVCGKETLAMQGFFLCHLRAGTLPPEGNWP